MADALGADGKCFSNGVGAGGFAGVVGEAQACAACLLVEGAKGLGAGAALVSAEADADDGRVVIAHFRSLAEDAVGFLNGEMANGVEDPVEGEIELAGGALAGALERFKDGLEGARIEVAPHVDDADGDVDLGVDDALLGELLHHAPGDEFVVFRIDKPAGDCLEGLDESGEVVEAVVGLGLAEGHGVRIVAGAEILDHVAGVMVPSRCRCSSALGRRRMNDSIDVMSQVYRVGLGE